jgi:hypothetical protein
VAELVADSLRGASIGDSYASNFANPDLWAKVAAKVAPRTSGEQEVMEFGAKQTEDQYHIRFDGYGETLSDYSSTASSPASASSARGTTIRDSPFTEPKLSAKMATNVMPEASGERGVTVPGASQTEDAYHIRFDGYGDTLSGY